MGLTISIANRKTAKIQSSSGLFLGGSTLKVAGEIYYDPDTKKYYHTRLNTLGTSVEVVEILTPDSLNQAIASIAKIERLRFQLYPVAAKDNWFWSGAISAPLPIGYQCKIINWKVWTINTIALNGTNNSAIDYMGTLGGGAAVVAAGNAHAASMVNKNVGFVNPANGSIGLFFKGATSPKKIQLIVNGSLKDGIDMEAEGGVADSGGGTPLNKLYVAEVTIQLDNSVIQNILEE